MKLKILLLCVMSINNITAMQRCLKTPLTFEERREFKAFLRWAGTGLAASALHALLSNRYERLEIRC